MIAKKPMARTSAQSQAAFRERHLIDPAGSGERLNIVIDASSKTTLERLAACYAVTQRVMLQRLLSKAQSQLLATLSSDQCNDYYDSKHAVTGVRLSEDLPALGRKVRFTNKSPPAAKKQNAGKLSDVTQ
jgi:hypothetical protein